jgi:acetyl esterase
MGYPLARNAPPSKPSSAPARDAKEKSISVTTLPLHILDALDPQQLPYIVEGASALGPPIYELSIADARAAMRDMQTADLSAYPVTTSQHITSGGCLLHIIRPRSMSISPAPIIFYLHGGGWALGSLATHERLMRSLAIGTNAAVVFPEYALSPESRFPVAVEQCYEAAVYIALHAASLGLNPERFAIAGDSAGGNLAAALTLLSSQRGHPRFCAQVLLNPVTDCDFHTASYDAFAHGLNLDRPTMEWFWSLYCPDAAQRTDPLASPLRASASQLRGLPPALIIVAGCDPLRDEGEAYAHKLSAAGVPVTAVRYQGAVHGFTMIDALAHTVPAQSSTLLFTETLNQFFHHLK